MFASLCHIDKGGKTLFKGRIEKKRFFSDLIAFFLIS